MLIIVPSLHERVKSPSQRLKMSCEQDICHEQALFGECPAADAAEDWADLQSIIGLFAN